MSQNSPRIDTVRLPVIIMKYIMVIKLTLIVFTLNVYSCSSSSLTIGNINKEIALPSLDPIRYETFWEAMGNADFDGISLQSLDSEHHNFVNALKFVLEGNIVTAENKFKELLSSSNDSLIRKYSKQILGSLLFSQSKWETLISLNSNEIDTTKPETVLARAFSKVPKEIYSFPSEPTLIPTTQSLSGVPIIEVEVNGYKKKFWLDTGAGLTVVASGVAQKCNIYPIGAEKSTAGTSTSKRVSIQPAIIENLKIGELLIKNHPIIIIDQKELEFRLFGKIRIIGIDGIIGWNAIKNLELEIDCKNGITTIKHPTENKNTERNFFWLDVPIIKLVTTDGKQLNFFVDTGANRTSIKQNIFKKLNIKNIQSKKATIGGAGGFERVEIKIASDLTLVLDGYSLHFDKISTRINENLGFIELDGKLGSDITKNKIVRIDYLNGRFELK